MDCDAESVVEQINGPHSPSATPQCAAVPAGIAAQILAAGGRVTFARFMDLALTHPDEGYYRHTGHLVGYRGHFSTAPHLSPAFNRAVARLLAELVDASLAGALGSDTSGDRPAATTVELGGGEGDLARAVLGEWDEIRPDLHGRVAYLIVEIGEALRARQRQALSEAVRRGWRVSWAADVSEVASVGAPSVVMGNEFIDALPVHVVDVRGSRTLESWVEIDIGEGGRIFESWDDLSPEAEGELKFLFGTTESGALRSKSRDGIIELRPAIASMMRQVAHVMRAGSLLTIDYGDWFGGGLACECDTESKRLFGRTLRAYVRHQLVSDPYIRVGQQDITADVDFRALDLHGREVGFETVLFTTLAALLRADGGEAQLAALTDRAARVCAEALEAGKEADVLRGLIDPEGLGGAFKVMLQVRE